MPCNADGVCFCKHLKQCVYCRLMFICVTMHASLAVFPAFNSKYPSKCKPLNVIRHFSYCWPQRKNFGPNIQIISSSAYSNSPFPITLSSFPTALPYLQHNFARRTRVRTLQTFRSVISHCLLIYTAPLTRAPDSYSSSLWSFRLQNAIAPLASKCYHIK